MIVTFMTRAPPVEVEQMILKLVAATGESAEHEPPMAPCPLTTIVSVISRFAQVIPVVEPVPDEQVCVATPLATVQVPISIALIAVPVPTVSVLPFTTDVLPFR